MELLDQHRLSSVDLPDDAMNAMASVWVARVFPNGAGSAPIDRRSFTMRCTAGADRWSAYFKPQQMLHKKFEKIEMLAATTTLRAGPPSSRDRQIAAVLRQAGWSASAGRVERVWRREGLRVPAKQSNAGVYG